MTANLASESMNVVWAPQEGSQRLFLECPFYEVGYTGTRGPGKTDALLMKFAQYTGRGFGSHWRGVIFRRECPQLEDIVAKSKRWFYQIFPKIKYLGSSDTRKWVWPTGEELLFRHMDNPDDYWKYHGHEYPFIGWEELTNWNNGECYESMKACCRSSYEDPAMPRCYCSTYNPYGVGHNWVKRYFVEPAPFGVPVKNKSGQWRVCIYGNVYENKKLLASDPEYIKNLESISDPNKRKAWLFGSFDITAGGMFDDLWRHSVHVIPPFRVPHSWRVERAFDWGSTAPFSFGWWAISDGTQLPDGRIYPRNSRIRIAEWYGSDGTHNGGLKMVAKDIAKQAKEREKEMGYKVTPGAADPAIYKQENGVCIANDMAREGITFVPANNAAGTRVTGWEKVRTLLKNAVDYPLELPGLYVFNTCRDFVRLVPATTRDKRNMEDVDSDTEDHIQDETRYEIMHTESNSRKVKVQG